MKIVRHCFKVVDRAGFGDYLRGTRTLWELSEQRGYTLKIYICHPILKQLIQYDDSDLDISDESVPLFFYGGTMSGHPHVMSSVIRHIESPGDVINICTNLNMVPDLNIIPPVSSKFQEFFQSKIRMTPAFEEYFNSTLIDLPEKFTVIQIRLVDPPGPREESTDRIQKVIDRIPKDNPCYLISSNSLVRDKLASIYGFRTLGTQVCHLTQGEGITDMDKVKETMVEFFLCSKASQLYQISIYAHVSGFTYWIANGYGVPFERLPI